MGIDKNNLQDIIKALRCLGSQRCMGDCYADFYNLHNYENEVDGAKHMKCRKETTDSIIGCPYYQSEYETCIDNGCGWLEEVADLLETIHCESGEIVSEQAKSQNEQEYTVNFLADIDMTVIAASPEEARKKAEKAFGEYRNKAFDYAYLAEIKYITKSDGTEA